MDHRAVTSVALFLGLAWPAAGRADFIYGGMATGAVITEEVTFLVGSTGPLPPGGGSRDVFLASSSSPSGLITGAISGIVQGMGGLATADITVNHLTLTFGGITITAQRLAGHAVADGQAGGLPTVSGFADFMGLVVNGTAVMVTGAANQEIDLPNNMRLLLNEQVPSEQGNAGSILLNALHLYVNPVVDFRVAAVEAMIDTGAGPAVPEPSTLVLTGVGLVVWLGIRRAGRLPLRHLRRQAAFRCNSASVR